ncbi:MAG: putative toxin-antitoxin system toxin component, PIN family [Gammaproteobacteria bacterium]
MRLVLDTDVIVAAMRSPSGASAAILMAALEHRVLLVANVPLVIEYEATCSLAEHRLAASLNEIEVRQFLDAVAAMIEPVETHFLWRPRLRDPGDEMVLEAAVNGRAGAIVTFNVRDYGDAPKEFGIGVLRPREVLQRLAK